MKDSIVERRLRYIERQKQLGHGVNVRLEGLKPEGSGPLNRHGLPSIPAGRCGALREMLGATVYSLSDEAGYTTG